MPSPQVVSVVGIDLSLTATGIAGKGWSETVGLSANGSDVMSRLLRLENIAELVSGLCSEACLAVIEAPSYGSRFGQPHERAGLFWIVVALVKRRGVRVIEVPPTTLKLYATANGTSNKKAVVQAIRGRYKRFGDPANDNECDALGLCAIGYHLLGMPLVPVPDYNAKALAKIKI
jgi:hypothetical protein